MATNPSVGTADRIAKSVTTAAAIIGLFVTGNTLLSSYSKDRIDRAASFRGAVNAEERFWSDLYTQYLAAVTDKTADDEQRRSKLMAIAMLATHQNPDFSEYGSDDRAKLATEQLDRMRQLLQDALTDERSSSRDIAQEIRFLFDQKTAVRDRDPKRDEASVTPPKVTARAQESTKATTASQPAVSVTSVGDGGASAASPFYGSRILATGSSSGWDVDVFWCSDKDDAATYARALLVGNALATASGEGSAIAPGVSLGRVRLRNLPSSQQQPGLYFAGDGIVADKGKGEDAAAKVLGSYIQEHAKVSTRQVPSVGALTNWYLSVFICA